MKRILITGANSYIGTSFEKYVSQYPDRYQVETIDMIGDSWRSLSFSGYDVVFHVAGIAHSDSGRISEQQAALYYQVNTDLTIETAKKAKAEGVHQFIFMSSIIVYGDSAPIGKRKVITKETVPAPAHAYGNSKLRAEKGLEQLKDDSFIVAILRPPMIYGKGCKGNYQLLARCARTLPVFPDISNQRSILYIENLCEIVRFIIDNGEEGVYHPQNKEQVSTTEIVCEIARVHGKRTLLIKGFSWLLHLMSPSLHFVCKAFGSLTIDQQLSDQGCHFISFQESIIRVELV